MLEENIEDLFDSANNKYCVNASWVDMFTGNIGSKANITVIFGHILHKMHWRRR